MLQSGDQNRKPHDLPGYYKSQQEKTLHYTLVLWGVGAGGVLFYLMGPEITRRLRASSEAEERHLSLRSGIRAPPAKHLSSWSQTPAGHPLVAHEIRLLSPSFGCSAAVVDREGHSSHPDPHPSEEVPPPDAAAPRGTHPSGALHAQRPPQRLRSLT